MNKIECHNPEHQDWLVTKYDPRDTPESFGRAPMFEGCHQKAASGHIYTAVVR